MVEASLEQALEAGLSGRRMQVHLTGGIRDKIETGGPERKICFIGKVTLDLLPL